MKVEKIIINSAILFDLPDLNILKVVACNFQVIVVTLGEKDIPTKCLKIKLFTKKSSETEKWMKRRLNEYVFGLSMEGHENIIKFERYMFSMAEGKLQFELLMEYGGSPLSENEFNQDQLELLMKQTASALAFSHSKNIFHSDIKAGNIMWNAVTRTAKIIDFDVSIKNTKWFLHAPTYEMGSMVLGQTILYCPPEFLQIAPLNKAGEESLCIPSKVDIYCWGITMFEVICGEKGKEIIKLFEDRKKGPEHYNDAFLKKVETCIKSKISKSVKMKFLSDIILTCLAYDATKRPSFEYIFNLLLRNKTCELPKCDSCNLYKLGLLQAGKYGFCKECIVIMHEFGDAIVSEKNKLMLRIYKKDISYSLINPELQENLLFPVSLDIGGAIPINVETESVLFDVPKEIISTTILDLINKGAQDIIETLMGRGEKVSSQKYGGDIRYYEKLIDILGKDKVFEGRENTRYYLIIALRKLYKEYSDDGDNSSEECAQRLLKIISNSLGKKTKLYADCLTYI